MIEKGTRVNVSMLNPADSPLIALLNSLGGEVIHAHPDNGEFPDSFLVAYDVEHLPAIQKANDKHFGGKAKTQLAIVGLNRSLAMPKDERYYLQAYLTEITPA